MSEQKITAQDLIDILDKGRRAQDLLEKVWVWAGPYGKPDNTPADVWRDIQDYFKFDDSE
jgi:hypothetical protein